jgi:hypothetical protein
LNDIQNLDMRATTGSCGKDNIVDSITIDIPNIDSQLRTFVIMMPKPLGYEKFLADANTPNWSTFPS